MITNDMNEKSDSGAHTAGAQTNGAHTAGAHRRRTPPAHATVTSLSKTMVSWETSTPWRWWD